MVIVDEAQALFATASDEQLDAALQRRRDIERWELEDGDTGSAFWNVDSAATGQPSREGGAGGDAATRTVHGEHATLDKALERETAQSDDGRTIARASLLEPGDGTTSELPPPAQSMQAPVLSVREGDAPGGHPSTEVPARDVTTGSVPADERAQRYADAIARCSGDGEWEIFPAIQSLLVRAVMAVADDEVTAMARKSARRIVEERREVKRLTRWCDQNFARAEAAERALADERVKVAAVYDVWNGTQNVNWLRQRIRDRWPELGRVLDGTRAALADPEPDTTGGGA
jgi:hypothetical protein